MIDDHALKQSFSDQKTKILYTLFLGFYLIWIVVAEALTIFYDPQVGLWAHASLLAGLLIHSGLDRSRPTGRVWLCLSLAPIIRIISLSTPLSGFPLIYWYLITGIPLFMAVFVMLRYLRLPRRELALQARWTPGQILVGLSGLALGYVEYLILRPDPLAPRDDPWAIIEAILILVVFTGLLEEIIFRGMMQGAIERVFGIKGVVYVALVFTILHLGYQSLVDMVFVFGVALYFGFYVHHTRSILGVALSHGLINVALFLIFPHLLGTPTLPVAKIPETATPVPVPATATPFQPSTPTSPPPKHTPTHLPTLSPTPPPTPIIIDDGDSGFDAAGGRWWLVPDGFGGDMYWDFAMYEFVTTEIEWRPQITVCGRYELEVYIPESYPSTQSANYLVNHTGEIVSVVVDQSAHQGQWVSLGQYIFDADGDIFLLLSNATGETMSDLIVVFDAARWTFQSPCAADSEP